MFYFFSNIGRTLINYFASQCATTAAQNAASAKKHVAISSPFIRSASALEHSTKFFLRSEFVVKPTNRNTLQATNQSKGDLTPVPTELISCWIQPLTSIYYWLQFIQDGDKLEGNNVLWISSDCRTKNCLPGKIEYKYNNFRLFTSILFLFLRKCTVYLARNRTINNDIFQFLMDTMLFVDFRFLKILFPKNRLIVLECTSLQNWAAEHACYYVRFNIKYAVRPNDEQLVKFWRQQNTTCGHYLLHISSSSLACMP